MVIFDYKSTLNAYRTGVFGRSQVVHYAMNLLVSWVFSNEGNEDALFSSVGLLQWLRNLLLDDHDPSVRREACTGLYKLCLGTTLSGARTGKFIFMFLSFVSEKYCNRMLICM